MIKRYLLGLVAVFVLSGLIVTANRGVAARVEEGTLRHPLGAPVPVVTDPVSEMPTFGADLNRGTPNLYRADVIDLVLWGDSEQVALVSFEIAVPSSLCEVFVFNPALHVYVESVRTPSADLSVYAFDFDTRLTGPELAPMVDAMLGLPNPPRLGQVLVESSGVARVSLDPDWLQAKVRDAMVRNRSSFSVGLLMLSDINIAGPELVLASDDSVTHDRPTLSMSLVSLGSCTIEPTEPLCADPYLCPGQTLDFEICTGDTYAWAVNVPHTVVGPSDDDEVSIAVSGGNLRVDMSVTVGSQGATCTYARSFDVLQFPAGVIDGASVVCPVVSGLTPSSVTLNAVCGALTQPNVTREFFWSFSDGTTRGPSASTETTWTPSAGVTSVSVELYQVLNGFQQVTPTDVHVISVRAGCSTAGIDAEPKACLNEPYLVNYQGSCVNVVWQIDGLPVTTALASGGLDISGLTVGYHLLSAVPTTADGCPGPLASLTFEACAPPPQPVLNLPIRACLGENIDADAGPGYLSYHWYVNNTLVSDERFLDHKLNATGTVAIGLELETTDGCSERFDLWSIQVPKPPNFSIKDDGGCCTERCRATIENRDDAEKVKWYLMVDGHEQYLDTTKHLSFRPPAGTDEIELKAEVTYETSLQTCSVKISGDLDVGDPPRCDIQGPKIACANGQEWEYSVSSDAKNLTWSIRQENDVRVLGDDDDQDIIFPWAGDWTVQVEAKDGDCKTIGEYAVVVRECGDVKLRVPDVLFCGSTATFELIGPPGMRTYKWSMTTGSNLGEIENSTNEHATWICSDNDRTDRAHVVFQLQYTDRDNCLHTAASDSIPVVCIPPLEIIAPNLLCEGEEGIFSVLPTEIGTSFAPCSYEWQVDGDLRPIKPNERAIKVVPMDKEQCSVRVRAKVGTVYGPWTECVEVPVILRPNRPIIEPEKVIQGHVAEFAPAAGLTNVTWSCNNNVSTAPCGTNGASVIIDDPGAYSITMYATNKGCRIEATHDFLVLPENQITVLGPGAYCVGVPVTFSASPLPNKPQWRLVDKNNTVISTGKDATFTWTPRAEDVDRQFDVYISGRLDNGPAESLPEAVTITKSPAVSIRTSDGRALSNFDTITGCSTLSLHADAEQDLVRPSWEFAAPGRGQIGVDDGPDAILEVPSSGSVVIEFSDQGQPCPSYAEVELRIIEPLLWVKAHVGEGKDIETTPLEGLTKVKVNDHLRLAAAPGFDRYRWQVDGAGSAKQDIEWDAKRQYRKQTIDVVLEASVGGCEPIIVHESFEVRPRSFGETGLGAVVLNDIGLAITIVVAIIGGFLAQCKKAWKRHERQDPVARIIFTFIESVLGLPIAIVGGILKAVGLASNEKEDKKENSDSKEKITSNTTITPISSAPNRDDRDSQVINIITIGDENSINDAQTQVEGGGGSASGAGTSTPGSQHVNVQQSQLRQNSTASPGSIQTASASNLSGASAIYVGRLCLCCCCRQLWRCCCSAAMPWPYCCGCGRSGGSQVPGGGDPKPNGGSGQQGPGDVPPTGKDGRKPNGGGSAQDTLPTEQAKTGDAPCANEQQAADGRRTSVSQDNTTTVTTVVGVIGVVTGGADQEPGDSAVKETAESPNNEGAQGAKSTDGSGADAFESVPVHTARIEGTCEHDGSGTPLARVAVLGRWTDPRTGEARHAAVESGEDGRYVLPIDGLTELVTVRLSAHLARMRSCPCERTMGPTTECHFWNPRLKERD